MKTFILPALLFSVGACSSTPPQTNIADATANNMIADDVTEVQDESVTSQPAEADKAMVRKPGKHEHPAQ